MGWKQWKQTNKLNEEIRRNKNKEKKKKEKENNNNEFNIIENKIVCYLFFKIVYLHVHFTWLFCCLFVWLWWRLWLLLQNKMKEKQRKKTTNPHTFWKAFKKKKKEQAHQPKQNPSSLLPLLDIQNTNNIVSSVLFGGHSTQ